MFADDSKIYMPIRDMNDCLSLQADISSICDWCDINKMAINERKCAQLSITRSVNPIVYTYTMNHSPINSVESISDLGVTISRDLSFSNHIHNIIKKANRRLWLVKRALGFSAPVKCKLQAYVSFVRPILEYCSIIWSPSSKEYLMSVESVQKHATNYILNNPPILNPRHINYKDRLLSCNLLPLSFRREIRDITFFYKAVNNFYDIDISHFINFVDSNRTR